MKIVRNILSLVLALAFFNVIVGKSLHVFFEHDHIEHTCENKNINHFHKFEITHADFICSFNFSTSYLAGHDLASKNIIRCFEQQTKVKYLWLVQNIFLRTLSLRGPPAY